MSSTVMMCSKWSYRSISDISTVVSGGTPSRNKQAYWANGTIPWVKTGQLSKQKITIDDIDEFITEEALSNSSAKIVPAGTILIAMYGQGKTRGTSAVLQDEAAINQACAALLLNTQVDGNYVFQQLLYNYDNLRKISNSGSQDNLSIDLIKSYKIPFPPGEDSVFEQRRIAEFLGTWDEAIEKLERLIEAKEKRLSWIRANILTGKVRINGFSSKWKQIIFLEIASRVTRSVGKERVAPVSISAGKGFVLQEEKFGRNIARKQYSKYTLLFPEEFTYNKGNSKTYECGCVYQWRGKAPVAVPNVFVSFSLNAKLADARFISHFFEADLHANELRKFINSGVRNDGLLNVTPDCFFKIILSLPELPEQKAIANILDTTSQEIDILRAELIMFQKQKRGLMQKLLTGTWRV